MTAKYKAPVLFSHGRADRVNSPHELKNQTQKMNKLSQKMENYQDSNRIAKEWVNQDLPVYAQTSKMAQVDQFQKMNQRVDHLGRKVYRTLEVSEEVTSSCSNTRIKSENRDEK